MLIILSDDEVIVFTKSDLTNVYFHQLCNQDQLSNVEQEAFSVNVLAFHTILISVEILIVVKATNHYGS